MVLYRDLCQLLAGHVVLVHVVLCDHRVQARERCAHEAFPLTIGSPGQRIGALVRADIGHLLDAGGDNDVFHPARDRDNSLAERKASRCARRLDTSRGDVPGCEAGVVGDQGADVFLPDEPACTHVPDVHRVDLLARELGIFKGERPCLDKDVTE